MIKYSSGFKKESGKLRFLDWVSRLEKLNQKKYSSLSIKTSLGNTQVWGLNQNKNDLPALVIFPGARTTPLFWDFDNGLKPLEEKCRIFLIETNGQPNNSDGNTPDIKSLDYGHWAAEVLDALKLDEVFIAGASFGGLVCSKLSITHPQRVKAAFLLNPGCLQSFSLTFRNLYYNLLPILFPSHKNVKKFLDKAVFCSPEHELSRNYESLIIGYEMLALTQYNDKTQKPYFMNEELRNVKAPVYLFEGDQDLLFPYEKSISNAKALLPDLKEVIVFNNVGHGIETYKKAIDAITNRIR
jgi:pimeloyl-ACP methyl ester carboxylesterase